MTIDEIFDKIGAQKGDVIINLNNKNFLLKIENNGDEKFSAHIYINQYIKLLIILLKRNLKHFGLVKKDLMKMTKINII